MISAPLLRAAAAVATATVTKSSARECVSLDVINHESEAGTKIGIAHKVHTF